MLHSALPASAAIAGWTGKGEAGVVLARGNTEATTANAKLDVARQTGEWRNNFYLGALYGKNAIFTTAQRFELRYQLDHEISERSFLFSGLNGIQDRFSGFHYQASVTSGIGYKFFDTETLRYAITFGVGYQRQQEQTLLKDANGRVLQRTFGTTTGHGIGSFGSTYSQQLTRTTRISDRLRIEVGSNNTLAENDVSFQVSVTDSLALSVGYVIRRNSRVPAGARNLDQLTTVNLAYLIR